MFCNGAEVCNASAQTADARGCVAGIAPEGPVDAGRVCTTFVCDEDQNAVVEVGLNDVACAEPSFCLFAGVCTNGTCVGNRNLDPDNNPCTVEACNGSNDVALVDPEDFNACTADTCAVGGAIQNTALPIDDDGVACTRDSCDAFDGMLHTPDDSLCSNFQVCDVDNGCVGDVYVNETSLATEADFCNVQFPTSTSIAVGESVTFFGQVFETGRTEAGGQAAGLRMQFGVAPASVTRIADFVFTEASFNVQVGNNDEFQSTFTRTSPEEQRALFRVSLDDGATWTACDTDGAGSNGDLEFSLGRAAVVNAVP